MNEIENYFDRLRAEIPIAGQKAETLIEDLQAHAREALEKGQSEAEVLAKIGSVEEVVASFLSNVDFEHAGFFERALAFVADIGALLLLALPSLLVLALLVRGVDTGILPQSHPVQFVFVAITTLAALALMTFYFPVLEWRFGRTIGKAILGIRVLDEDHTRIGLGQAILRRLSLYFEILVLDALFVPFTKKKQRAFDIVARTVVVRDPADSRSGWRFVAALGLGIWPALVAIVFVILRVA